MPFELFVVQHSHIDIGYTERQERIADYHAQFIAQAVRFAFAEQQSQRSPDARFRFTLEGFWAIEQFLRRYGQPGQSQLVSAIRAGHLELSAFYVHLSELLDEGHLRDSIQYARNFAREYDLPLRVGMASDINGFSWGMADILADAGIRYLITNLNSHHGGPPFQKPMRPFYWESPRGQNVLVWSGLAYHKANLLGLMPGYTPAADPGIPGMQVDSGACIDVQDIAFAEERIYKLVDTLAAQQYPYQFLPIMGSGLYTDNSPVTDACCELIERWNRVHGSKIHIRTASLEDFFHHLEEHGGEIPTHRGDWNDWWTDGVISTPFEVRLFRNAQRTKRLVEMLDPQAEIVSQQQRDAIANKLILYAEHTWGHSNSYTDPWKLLVQQLDARKASLAIDADRLAATALDQTLQAYGEGEFTSRRPFEYRVINPLSVAISQVVYLPIDFWEVDVFQQGYRVTDQHGVIYKAQRTMMLRGQMIAVEIHLAPREIRDLKLEPAASQPFSGTLSEWMFENQSYRLQWDDAGIQSLISRENGCDLLAGSGMLAEPIYQLFPQGDRRDAAGFGYQPRRKPEQRLSRGTVSKVEVVEHGEVLTRLRVAYAVDGASVYQVYFTLYAGLPQIGITVEMTKDIVMDPEGMYSAFPFTVTGGKWYLDKVGALILPGRDQLPGTCCDYYAVIDGAVLAGDDSGVALTVLDAPMVTIGGIKLWDFTTSIDPSGTLYSWLCNNKWETNFRADCGGFHEYRYVVEFSARFREPAHGLECVRRNSYEALVIRK